MQKITPCLWFDRQAEEAARFYCSVFKDSKLGKISYYGDAMPMPKDTVLTVTFSLMGQEYMALNGGPEFKFTDAISLIVHCEDQKEIDYYWRKLSAVTESEQCGWLKDKFGLSWQVVPYDMDDLLDDEDPVRSARVMKAVLGMKKLDMAEIQRAYDGK